MHKTLIKSPIKPLKRSGFTLIELLVVITIIGVLAALITANLSDARARARDAKVKQNLVQLKTALRLYYNDNQAYPADDTIINDPGFSVYMKQLPDQFTYQSDDTDGFTLWVALENPSDPDIATSQTACPAPGEITYSVTDFVVCAD